MAHSASGDLLVSSTNGLLMHTAGPMQTARRLSVYGQIDMTTGAAAIVLAVAGHPPPLIVRKDGSVQTTSAHGTMLGAVDDPVFHTGEVNLQPGDAIVICSGGIFDTQLGGIRVDEQHVAELLSGGSHASARDLVNGLISALDDVDRPLRDDIAIMTLQRPPTA